MSKETGFETLPPRMLPALNDDNRAFWTGGSEGRLMILRCQACEIWVHPTTSTCPKGHEALVPTQASGRGLIWTYTVNRHPFHPSVPVPYIVAIVELAEQANLRIVANIIGCRPEDMSVGMSVRVSFEEQGEVFVPVFAPE
ncbi:MAG: OB-fold domain-containing protein [Proteobacteria bacterium]|nr:OB-fold domain-containing protein [Pseudomonadota bacterium]